MPAYLILNTIQYRAASSVAAASISSETGGQPVLRGGKQRHIGLPLFYAELAHADLRTIAGHREMQGRAGGAAVALRPYNCDNDRYCNGTNTNTNGIYVKLLQIDAPYRHPIGFVKLCNTTGIQKFSIQNAYQEPVFTAVCEDPIQIISVNGNDLVAQIKKEKESGSTEVIFQFPMDMDAKMKAVIMGALLYVNYRLQEIYRQQHSSTNNDSVWMADAGDFGDSSWGGDFGCDSDFGGGGDCGGGGGDCGGGGGDCGGGGGDCGGGGGD
ncbi:uncharacterized protein O3C94_008510 [Discoglossus pictus]